MRILLTGGTGFIGKNIVEGLCSKYKILAPSHQELELLDLKQLERYIKKNNVDILIHTAVKGGYKVCQDMLRVFINIIKIQRKLKKIIYFGSGAEYGKTRNLIKVKETELGKFIPEDDYGLGKFICTKLVSNNNKFINLRLFGVFGKGEDYRKKFISNSIVKNILGLPIDIKQNVVFDYLYISDLIPVVEYFIENKAEFPDYNVTPDKSISLKEIAEIVNSISNRKSRITIVNKGLNYQYTGSNKLLKKTIKKISFTSYKSAIIDLFNYYLKLKTKLDRTTIIKDEYFQISKIKI